MSRDPRPGPPESAEDAVLDYLKGVDAGAAADPAAVLAAHPELAGELERFFTAERLLRGRSRPSALAPPRLVEASTGLSHRLDGKVRVLVGRGLDADVRVRDRSCSRVHFELISDPAGVWSVRPLAPDNPTLVNDTPVRDAVALRHGDRIEAGETAFEFQSAPAPDRVPGDLTVPAIGGRATPAASPVGGPIPVAAGGVIGRDRDRAWVCLPHPNVSRLHALVAVRGGGVTVTDLRSTNGTFVNGHRIARPVRLSPGDRMDVGPYTLRFDGRALTQDTRADNAGLSAVRLTRLVRDSATGRPVLLLDDVSVAVRPGEFVCLLGPSGSGKSTLLAALSGRISPDRGRVFLNDADLYADFAALKRDIAVVPQRNLLLDTLTVEQALTYTARLRLPADTSAEEVRGEVDELIRTVGLDPHRHTPVGRLSGGQAKRVSLANELLGRPTLVFLDEVTSGLDEQTDREMMDLFRKLADAGKTVVCVTHSLAHVERSCHLVAVLAAGGVMAFVGTPAQALRYFGVERLGNVYDRLAGHDPEEWRRRFRESDEYALNVAARVPASAPEPTGPAAPEAGPWAGAREVLRQGQVLTRRRLALLRGGWPALATLAVQTAVVAAALLLVFGDLRDEADPVAHARSSVTLYFLLAVSSFWFGCNGAVKVVVGDRPIYRRERAVNLSLLGYAGSTFAVYCAVALVQTTVLAGAVWAGCRPPGMGAEVAGVLAADAAAGTALGLALSAAARSEEMAVAAVPLVLIPQIVFGGVVAGLSGPALWVAKGVVTTYWAHRAISGLLPEDVAALAGADPAGAGLAVGVVVGHAVVFAAAALVVLWRQDARRSSGAGTG